MPPCIHGGVLRGTVPHVIRSVIGEQSSERYNANNTRKTENSVSYRSFIWGPIEEEVGKSYRITRCATKCNENEIRLISFSLLSVFSECSLFHLVTFILWYDIFPKLDNQITSIAKSSIWLAFAFRWVAISTHGRQESCQFPSRRPQNAEARARGQ